MCLSKSTVITYINIQSIAKWGIKLQFYRFMKYLGNNKRQISTLHNNKTVTTIKTRKICLVIVIHLIKSIIPLNFVLQPSYSDLFLFASTYFGTFRELIFQLFIQLCLAKDH